MDTGVGTRARLQTWPLLTRGVRSRPRPVTGLQARDDRVLDAPVFSGFSADRLRTAIARACRAAGIPAFSPHDLRHRRISLLHLGGVPWARIGEHVGQRNLAVTANVYTHVMGDETEIDYDALIEEATHRATARV